MSKSNPAASIKVEESDSALITGKIIIGDKNCPRNQKVVSFPISLPLISGGTIFITHMLVLGIIIPIPNPDNIIAITTIEYVLAKEMHINPAAMNKYPMENTERKLNRPLILE